MYCKRNHIDSDDMMVPLAAFCTGKIIGLAVGVTIGVICRNRIMKLSSKIRCCKGNKMLQLGRKKAHEDDYEDDSNYFTLNSDETLTEKVADVTE